MSEYNIKDKGLKKDSEATSAMSIITHEVIQTKQWKIHTKKFHL
jgi:hypothetical protein